MFKKIIYSKYILKYNYYVSESGEIYSEQTNKFLAQFSDRDGYLKVRLVSLDGRHTYSVHRLVLENFCPLENMNNLQVNHKDGNKQNNSLANLEWVSCQENIAHAIQHNLRAEVNGAAKLTETQVLQIYERANINHESNVCLAQEFGVHPDTIGKIKHKKTWKKLLNAPNDYLK